MFRFASPKRLPAVETLHRLRVEVGRRSPKPFASHRSADPSPFEGSGFPRRPRRKTRRACSSGCSILACASCAKAV